MIVQEPVKATIWFSLNHYAFNDATFLAERLHSEVASEDTLHLLATCYYQSGKAVAAYSLLSKSSCKSGPCKLLWAKCCVDLKKYSEAEEVLGSSTQDSLLKSSPSANIISQEELKNEYGDSAAFVAQLLGLVSVKTERSSRAIKYYNLSLKLNPFLWSSYEALIQLGVRVDPSKLFTVSNTDFNFCHGSNALVSLWNTCSRLPPSDGGVSGISSQTVPLKDLNLEINSPFAVIKPASVADAVDVFTPETCNWNFMACQAAPVKQNPDGPKSLKKSYLSTQNSLSSRTETPVGVSLRTNGIFSDVFSDPKAAEGQDQIEQTEKPKLAPRAPSKRQQPRQGRVDVVRTTRARPNIFSQSGNINQDLQQQQSTQQNLRRSSRLFNSSSSVKENTTKPTLNQENKKNSIGGNNSLPKKARRSSSTITSEKNLDLMNEHNKSDHNIGLISGEQLALAGLKMQRSSAEVFMTLLRSFAKAYCFMSQYQLQKAIQVLLALPPKHLKSGFALSSLGRCHFELAQYSDAIKYYEEGCQVEPHRVQGLEYYSTALWHLQQEVKLSMLSQKMIEYDKNCPQTWCVAGNCFSLQKEHEAAIKYLQRAIQVDPDFAYAYTLLGHELVVTEEMDHAMACYRNAIRIDPRHYNAWYGIGMISYKQEKFQLAEVHYRKALEINPNNSTLRCHLAVVLHALKKVEQSFETLDEALKLDPDNVLCKFHRASFYCSAERHQEALAELEALKVLSPKESLVYFLIGKVYKRLGNTHLALMNFSWAMDLDPKGANNQIKGVIDRQYANDDDEVVVCVDSGDESISRRGSQSMEAEASFIDADATF